MSATQRTENYNLPIFIETDKPAWLVDFNGAMRSIDAQMKANAEAIVLKSPILTFQDTADIDFTKTGDIVTANLQSAITDKVGRALITPLAAPAAEQLVAIDTNGNQAAVEIGSGLLNDNGTLKAIDLNLTDQGTGTISGFITGTSLAGGSINYSLNSDASIGKIYGTIGVTKTTSGDSALSLDTGIIVDAPASSYNIIPVGISFAGNSFVGGVSYSIETNGHVILHLTARGNNQTWTYLYPCMYIFKDFGDTPQP